jgi:hypothetical protein
MTMMNWSLSRDTAALVSDTVVSDLDANEPMGMRVKVWPAPQYGYLMGAWGWGFPITGFSISLLSGRIFPRSVEDAAAMASVTLKDLAGQGGVTIGGQPPASTSFLFGWSEEAGRMVGFEFKSRSDYQPRALPDGAGLFPPLTATAPVDVLGQALAQCREDAARSGRDRCNLGGWLISHELSRGPDGDTRIDIRNLGPLPGFDRASAKHRETIAAGRAWML